MLESKFVETIVGLFVALGVAALFMLAMKVSNLSSLGEDGGYDVTARFLNIGGLKVRSPVKMAGVVIGRVKDIELDRQSYEAVATLSLASKFDKIPTDTSANIYTAGLLGEQYVSLDPGAEDTFLKDGDRITLTQSAVVLEQLIGRFLYQKAAGDEG
ncbi:MAG: outer membrane lipid asymmetry maintenance protein MlaD [Gammaproteobacteria bacterium]|nr:outer membrane lipid asymmetry maintenance protein MlaD [Gammaproteobacteria bacterium]MCI0591070.1 outer membrane lipid asymmetry maintenance protein MlaD [Gammaproteobacteria bacterium]